MFRTLIIEDNDAFREVLKRLLSSRFPLMVFEEVKDGDQALQKVEAFDPHLVFVDIKLPGKNGLEVTKQIRASNCEATVIILTSYDSREYRDAADLCGANHFLSKSDSTAHEILAVVAAVYPEAEPK